MRVTAADIHTEKGISIKCDRFLDENNPRGNRGEMPHPSLFEASLNYSATAIGNVDDAQQG